MFSVRMRASKRSGGEEVHISGAEGIFSGAGIRRAAGDYLMRAMSHPRGEPDRVVLTIERITARPRAIAALPVATLRCSSPLQAREYLTRILLRTGVGCRAIGKAMQLVRSDRTMRGASLMDAATGRRLEPDKSRGVRASRIGVSAGAARQLGRRLSRFGINTGTVREALLLASKVSSCGPVVAELCVSDDPDYTTGYVASGRFGYVRIPNIKEKGSPGGGRIFFLSEGADLYRTISFLEETPVIISSASACGGACSLDEIIGPDHS